MSHYEFQRLDCLANIDPTNFGSRGHLVSAVQCRGIRKKDGSTPTTNISAQKEIEKKRKDRKRKIYTDNSIVTRKTAPNKSLVTKARRVNDDSLQLGGTLARRLNHDKPQLPK